MAPIRTFLVGLLLAGSVTSAMAQTSPPPRRRSDRRPSFSAQTKSTAGLRYRPIGRIRAPVGDRPAHGACATAAADVAADWELKNRVTVSAHLSPR